MVFSVAFNARVVLVVEQSLYLLENSGKLWQGYVDGFSFACKGLAFDKCIARWQRLSLC